MVFYPALCGLLEMDPAMAGFFLGATIHDVAQVVGAGYSYSEPTGDLAVFTKMLRVALLIPVVITVGFLSRRQSVSHGRAPVPGFFGLRLVIPDQQYCDDSRYRGRAYDGVIADNAGTGNH